MDENENEEFLEDSLEAYIGELIEFARGLPPGSEEQASVARSIKELYTICVEYTEIGMKYRSEEDQRKHELEIKKLDLEMKEKELALEETIRLAQIKEQKYDRRVDAALKGISAIISAGTVAAFVCLQAANMKAEYVNSQFMTSGIFKNISNVFGKFIKPPTSNI